MARQHTPSQGRKSIARAALITLGLAILFGKLEGPAAQLNNIVYMAARETLGLVPYFLPTVWQTLHAYASDHQPFSPCAFQMLVSCWPLLRVVAGAV